ncbi:RNA-directed DNA polymerase (reverse transcriptase) domain containing [Paramuricea clavata]|uniref:RNA-directed DNA polymerase (Reverse transcriptase) domain containing n=1 Tax=Paramuricea clavata TaxID=317549 RepID=A0A7D9JFH8_PARCT|nr:RNA-directed DNA polymerase (reverse transcriptase) domain containing [Paramuricea clavata]
MERKLEFQQESCWGFLDLEKAYDKINRGMIPPVLRLYNVPEELINMVMALYRSPSTQVRTCFGKTKAFAVNVGLHQGSALSPLLFIIMLDYISKQCPMERGHKVIYADDIALGANKSEELQQAVDMWDNQLAVHGMRMSKKKTEVLEVSRGQPVPRLEITVDGQQLKQTTAFKYLGSWQHESGDLDREITGKVAGYREYMEECLHCS